VAGFWLGANADDTPTSNTTATIPNSFIVLFSFL
jgi:hypothetical protein